MSSPPCVTATPDKYGHVPFDACNSYYSFNPSFAANLAFTVLFGLSTVTHVIQAAAFKRTFCWVLIMGGIWETAAFALRTVGSHHQQELQFAIWGQILFLLAPLWINAFAYMTVARMVHFGLPEKKIWGVRAVRLTVLFVWLDVVCFLVQAAGGSMLSNNDDANITKIGMRVYTAGIGVQLAFVIIFGFMTAWFYRKAYEAADGRLGRLRFLIWTMIAVLLLIVMRIVFRLVEFGPGFNSSNQMITKEVYPLALDAMPMVLALTLLNIVHPGIILRGPDGEFPKKSRAEKKAIKQAKKEAKLKLREQKLTTKQAAKEQKKAQKQAKQGKVSDSFAMMELGSRSDDSDYGHGTR